MYNVPFRHTNLRDEPAEYLARREELRLAEIDLTRQRERVAELRRQLPAGAIVEIMYSRRARRASTRGMHRCGRFA